MLKSILRKFSFKRENLKTFLFFLIFTSFLWLFTQFSKNYTKEVTVTVRYLNMPKNKILNDQSDHTLRMTLSGNGFRLMTHKWKESTVAFDLNNAGILADSSYFFRIDNKGQLLKQKLDFNGSILGVEKDTLRVMLDINLEKKVPLQLQQKVKYAQGYGSERGVQLTPDSILISGPKKMVDSIHQIQTELLDLEELNSDYKTTLVVNRNDLPRILKITPAVVDVNVSVSKFTEGSQEIPITLINVPEGKEVKIFPKVVKVVYRVGLDKYNQINQRDFKVIADYKSVSSDSSFLILKLDDIAVPVHDVRLQEKQVQFVILN